MIAWALLLAAVAAAEPAEPSPPPAVGPQPAVVRRLVAALNDNQLARREAAERQLLELGPDVLPLLPGEDEPLPAEARQRLTRVRRALEELASRRAAEATRVTLHGNLRLSDTLRELEKQTGNKLIDFRPRFGQQAPDPQLNLALDNAPFWLALDTILDQAGLTLYNFHGQSGALAIVAADPQAAPRKERGCYAGLFRFEATQLEALRDLRVADRNSLKLTLEVTWEPRVRPIVLEQPRSAITATADNGQAIGVVSPQGRLDVAVQETVNGVDLVVPLVPPSREVRALAQVRGQLTALVPGRTETFRFTRLHQARNIQQRRGGVNVVLEEVRKNADLYEIRIVVRFDDAAGALQSHLDWISSNEAFLEGPGGQRLEQLNFERFREQENEVGFAYLCPLEGRLEDYAFVYKTPAAIIPMPVRYELKDIPLP